MPKDFSFYLKKFTGITLLLALSAVFLFSAVTKLLALEPFEWTFLELLPVGFTGAAIIARLFIGLEICIALFLLAHIYLRRFTYKIALAILTLLTGYLILLLSKQGNNGNCGCFGDTYQMKPLEAIYKNMAMAVAIVVLYFIYPATSYRRQSLAAVAALIIGLALPFSLSPVYLSGKGEVTHERIFLKGIYDFGVPKPTINLQQGKHIIAFLSLTCPHCRKAAYLMQILYLKDPQLPFYMVLNGRKEGEAAFFGETKSAVVPHTIIRDVSAFRAMAGEYVPAIYWVSNSTIERKTYYTELDPKGINAWLTK